eukprot:6197242-Pleurochrysis_carterae.AAC.2
MHENNLKPGGQLKGHPPPVEAAECSQVGWVGVLPRCARETRSGSGELRVYHTVRATNLAVGGLSVHGSQTLSATFERPFSQKEAYMLCVGPVGAGRPALIS